MSLDEKTMSTAGTKPTIQKIPGLIGNLIDVVTADGSRIKVSPQYYENKIVGNKFVTIDELKRDIEPIEQDNLSGY